MTYETIRMETDPRGVAQVVLNRPDKHNAMDAQMIAELTDAARQLAEDNMVRVVVLRGEGKTFCAGGDLGWMRSQAEQDRAGKIAEARKLADMLGLWNALPKPVIGRIHGAAFGGGLGLLAICDVAVAERSTRFALTETRLGLIPATIGPFVMRKLGEGYGRQVFLNSKPFDADFLWRAGAVAKVCAAEQLDETVEAEVNALLQCAPSAVADAKALCLSLKDMSAADAYEASIDALANRWETAEAQDGIRAFFAKEAPAWRETN
ncbi:crotonase/enoyl-CoA hydratase family protein [Qingshengfaniella alkalisoli]|uniref:Crotonase/enoyl-CoA hydratase family protein n=1 Tax=Qingshengfaniella alkalisoli TaxID=2599296 RepID=A0A5B8I7E2_9RHOB|nr:crotonase/enoyl-CoA hydratase family protein [Qingshengfaniella alkalisoli]QDY69479.1 crotonase/enoyl-CoA hydratase family protein [Qingshengfaniella alkalisoli]